MIEFRKCARGAFIVVLLAVFAAVSSSAEPVGVIPGTAALQMHVERFLHTMFTYSVPGDEACFPGMERYMTDETAVAWREWYSKWLKTAFFARVSSSVAVGQVIVDPRKGPNGEIRARANVRTFTSMFGKSYESDGVMRVVLRPVGEGTYGVSLVRHESAEGGVFELSVGGVSAISGMKEGEFDRMVMEDGTQE